MYIYICHICIPLIYFPCRYHNDHSLVDCGKSCSHHLKVMYLLLRLIYLPLRLMYLLIYLLLRLIYLLLRLLLRLIYLLLRLMYLLLLRLMYLLLRLTYLLLSKASQGYIELPTQLHVSCNVLINDLYQLCSPQVSGTSKDDMTSEASGVIITAIYHCMCMQFVISLVPSRNRDDHFSVDYGISCSQGHHHLKLMYLLLRPLSKASEGYIEIWKI